MRFVVPAAILLAFFSLCACSPSLSSGPAHLTAGAATDFLSVGQTTRGEVFTRLGAPQATIKPREASQLFFAPDAGRHPLFPEAEVWTYHASRLQHTFALDPRQVMHRSVVLRLYFDASGVLKDYALRESVN